MCECARLCRCERAFGGLHGPPELLAPSPCLLKLLAVFGGEVIPDQELYLVEFQLEDDSFIGALPETAMELGCQLSRIC